MFFTARLPDAAIKKKVSVASISAHPETENTATQWHVGVYDVNVSSITRIQSEANVVDFGEKGSRWIQSWKKGVSKDRITDCNESNLRRKMYSIQSKSSTLLIHFPDELPTK